MSSCLSLVKALSMLLSVSGFCYNFWVDFSVDIFCCLLMRLSLCIVLSCLWCNTLCIFLWIDKVFCCAFMFWNFSMSFICHIKTLGCLTAIRNKSASSLKVPLAFLTLLYYFHLSYDFYTKWLNCLLCLKMYRMKKLVSVFLGYYMLFVHS